jgi:multidrug efflux pump subunit AcrA (membrane-fusion protein)
MAWLESAELGEAKVDYLVKWAEVGCCTIDLARAQEVHDNTILVLEFLKFLPSLDALREMNGGAMGEYRSDLVSAYAEFVFAREAYHREKRLLEKKVASQSEYQAAEAAYKKADALYVAERDSIGFKIRRDLLEAKREQQVRAMELKGAERRLYVLGLTGEDIKILGQLTQEGAGTATKKVVCNDPNCTDCAGHSTVGGSGTVADLRGIEERLAWYPLRAPFCATVIDRHLTLGEKHGDDSNAFTIADLTSVWVDISVYQKDLSHVRKGQLIRITTPGQMTSAEGKISFVAPTIDAKTRTALARVVLPNPQGTWRPGLFVTAELSIGQESTSVVVPKTAVQQIGETPVIFVDTDDALRPVRVSLGRGDTTRVEVLSGLMPDQRYVVEGAFELKAKIVTSGLGAHAGHGH